MRRHACWILSVAAVALVGCGGDDERPRAFAGGAAYQPADPGPIHVHGLGVNPADGALFIATHSGLFRSGPGEETSRRVAGISQDTMGFTVIGPNQFLGSGHPDLRTKQPPFLGLIKSKTAGNSWKPISLYGKADFHVLESSGRRVVGYGSDFETRREQLLVSDDEGRTWSPRRSPMPLIDLAVSPRDRDTWVASGEQGIARTTDGGRTWKSLPWGAGLLAWNDQGQLYRVDGAGGVSVSGDAGSTWSGAGELGGEAGALQAEPGALYAALHDGVIKMSRDGGRSWVVRSRPKAG